MDISIEEQIRIIMRRKDEIKNATNNISEAIKGMKATTSQKALLIVKQEIHNIVNNLNIIGSFCDRDARRYIMKLSNLAMVFTKPMNQVPIPFKTYLEAWCTVVNSISPDFSKLPFKIAKEFQMKFKGLETQYKGLLKFFRQQPIAVLQ